MEATERLISEVTTIKNDLQTAIKDQASQSQKIIDETHTAYESTISVLHSTINRLQRSLTTNFHGPEILQLTKEIHRLLFKSSSPTNQQLTDAIKAQFQEAFSKIDGLRKWLEEAQVWTTSRGGSEKDQAHQSHQSDHDHQSQ